MTAKVTNFDNFDAEADYDERTKKEPVDPKGVGVCCICDNGSSWCAPEQFTGSFVTLATAHTFAYWYTY